MKSSYATYALLFLVMNAHADSCKAPPVELAAQAICIAKNFVNTSSAIKWEIEYTAKSAGDTWQVQYKPHDSSVRGGSGELAVNTASGEVKVVQIFR